MEAFHLSKNQKKRRILGNLTICPDSTVTLRHSRCFSFFTFGKPHAHFSHAFPSSRTCSEGRRKRMTGLFPLCRQRAAVKVRFVRARRGGNVSGIQRWKVEELKGDTAGGKNTVFILEPVSWGVHCDWNYIRKDWQGDREWKEVRQRSRRGDNCCCCSAFKKYKQALCQGSVTTVF